MTVESNQTNAERSSTPQTPREVSPEKFSPMEGLRDGAITYPYVESDMKMRS